MLIIVRERKDNINKNLYIFETVRFFEFRMPYFVVISDDYLDKKHVFRVSEVDLQILP